MAILPAQLIGNTGKRYRSLDLLQERAILGCVWTALSENNKFVLKDVPNTILAHFDKNIHPRLCDNASPLLRLPVDRIKDRDTLVYDFMTDDLLRFIEDEPSTQIRRNILKTSIEAIADLHSRDVVHLDIKPNQIMMNYKHEDQGIVLENTQLTDLENAAYLPDGRRIKGMLAGNENWRSPEAFFRGELNKPCDVFAFGLVCLYAMTGKVTLGCDEDFHHHESQGVLPDLIRLQRQVSYFGDAEGVEGLLTHLGDDEFNKETISSLWEGRNDEEIPYKPFTTWPEAEDEAFRDVIKGTTNLDPSKRLTALEVLKLPWFSE